MKTQDYFLTDEKFEVLPSDYDGVLKTTPVPSENEMYKYYDSKEYFSYSNSETKGFIPKLYQAIKKYRLKKRYDLIFKTKNSLNVLEVGAGSGAFSSFVLNKNHRVDAVEWNSKQHDVIRDGGVKNVYQNLTEIKSDTKYDYIILWHVLEHIQDLEESILKMKSLLSKDGRMVFALPNFKSFDANYYKRFWAGYDVPRHIWHFSPKGIQNLMTKQGFQFQKSHKQWLDVFYVALLSEKYKKNSLAIIYAFIIGLYSNFKAIFNGQTSAIVYIFKNK